MAVKMVESISIFLCENCSSVHIGLWRHGRMFAEAIPVDIDTLVDELNAAVAESKARQGITNTPSTAHKH